MNGLVNLGWALLCILGAACLLIWVIADHAEITRRLRQAGHLLAGAIPWFVAAVLHPWSLRGRTLQPPASPAHPAGRAIPASRRPVITSRERREFDAITKRLDMPEGAQWPVSGEGR